MLGFGALGQIALGSIYIVAGKAVTSGAIGKMSIGIGSIGVVDKESRMTLIPTSFISAVVLLSGSGVGLSAPGVLAGDLVERAFDMTTGADVSTFLGPRAPVDGTLFQAGHPGDAAGHPAIVQIRRMVSMTAAIELIPSM